MGIPFLFISGNPRRRWLCEVRSPCDRRRIASPPLPKTSCRAFGGPRSRSATWSQWSIPLRSIDKRQVLPLLRSSMCSEWGLLTLARRTYSSKCPPDISRCGLIASSTTASRVGGPRMGIPFLFISGNPLCQRSFFRPLR